MSSTAQDTKLGTDDDQGFQPGFSQRRPIFARDLLKQLGVQGEGLEAQRRAVALWLTENAAGRALTRSLRRARLI